MTDIKAFIRMDMDEWRQLTSQMAWALRNGSSRPPTAARKFLSEMPTAEHWRQVRKAVNAGRLKLRREQNRYTTERRVEHRRVYMREYMRGYRKRVAGSHPVSPAVAP